MKRAALALCSLSLVAVGFVACLDEEARYVYTAQKYDPALGCLGDYAPVESVLGDGVSSTCAPTCLSANDAIYLSTVCPPVPAIATMLDARSPECQAALDASRLEASCAAPEETEDGDAAAEPDAAEGTDAAEDAPALEDSGAPDVRDAGDGG